MQITTREECYEIIETVLIELLAELGQEPDAIELTTMLNADLGITSIDAIHLMVLLEDHIGRAMSFQDLAIRNGRYVDDIAVGELLDFVAGNLQLPPAAAAAQTASGS